MLPEIIHRKAVSDDGARFSSLAVGEFFSLTSGGLFLKTDGLNAMVLEILPGPNPVEAFSLSYFGDDTLCIRKKVTIEVHP